MRIEIKVVGEEGERGLENAEQYADVLQQAADLYVAKTQSYGAAWQEQGYMGNLARILSKCARLKNMVWQDYEFEDGHEGVVDSAMDLINITAFFIMNKFRRNKWGNR